MLFKTQALQKNMCVADAAKTADRQLHAVVGSVNILPNKTPASAKYHKRLQISIANVQ